MKLIIDIPESAYDFLSQTVDAIANGTPLTESDDCVSREDAIHCVTETELYNETFAKAKMRIAELPSVQPKRDKGKWYIYQDYWYECSKCGCLRYMTTFTENYCPNCGADMKG